MLMNVLIAAFVTLGIYIVVEFVKSIRQFLIFKRVRTTILMSIFHYLKKTPQNFVDLHHLKGVLLNRLKETKMSAWVRDITISWHSADAIEFVFELNFKKVHPKYKFVIGLEEFEHNRTGRQH